MVEYIGVVVGEVVQVLLLGSSIIWISVCVCLCVKCMSRLSLCSAHETKKKRPVVVIYFQENQQCYNRERLFNANNCVVFFLLCCFSFLWLNVGVAITVMGRGGGDDDDDDGVFLHSVLERAETQERGEEQKEKTTTCPPPPPNVSRPPWTLSATLL